MADNRGIPGGTERDLLNANIPDNPEELLLDELFPEDSYQSDTYWADLPAGQRAKWVNKQYITEVGREVKTIWPIFKNDPLAPLAMYFRNYVVTGFGFFSEGYVLFSVGNVLILLQSVWPQCWKVFTVCNETWVHSISYLEICGIIVGQIMIGIIGDFIGRRWGIIQDAATMLLGTIMLTVMWGLSLNGWVIMYAVSLLVFGIGVGGEYPMTSTTAMERVQGPGARRDDRLHRGRNVLLAFLMQGWGQLANQLVLIVTLLIFHHGNGNPPYNQRAAQYTFRISFGVAVLFLIILLYIRIFRLRDVDKTAKASKKRQKVTGYDVQSLRLVSSHYWHRLFATSVCWFCNDFPFYGNQIFRNVFLALVTSSPDQVMTLWLYNLVNVGCELVGYYLAAMLIDYKFYGRRRMQMVGFIMLFLLFIIAAGTYPLLNKKGAGGDGFQFIYFFSSFWIQFGSNSTTFLVAAEVYPAPVRATAHGVSAAVGKLGALAATVLYNYIVGRVKFWVVSWFGLIGFVLTLFFIPDTTGLDLREQERYWKFVREGRPEDYHGIAVHPRHLSMYERYVLHRDRAYNPKLDREGKIEELRSSYQSMRSSDSKEDLDHMFEDDTSQKISKYFEWEQNKEKGV